MSERSTDSLEFLLNKDEKDNAQIEPLSTIQCHHTLRTHSDILLLVVTVSTIITTIMATTIGISTLHNARKHTQPTQPHYAPWTSCGSDPTTARSRGCTFDIISFTWQTAECYDAALTADFAAWQDWTWYADEFENTTIPRDIALLGEQDAWVDWHYHVVHCTFMWRGMHRAFERGWIGDHLNVYDHTVHCQHTFLEDAVENAAVRTPAIVLYPKCTRVGGGVGMYPGPQFGS